MPLKVKRGVPLDKLEAPMLYALGVARTVFDTRDKDCIVTSTYDGNHSPESLHYQNQACDLRTRHLTTKEREDIAFDLDLWLEAEGFDVVYEPTVKKGKKVIKTEHLHIEYQPKVGDKPWYARTL